MRTFQKNKGNCMATVDASIVASLPRITNQNDNTKFGELARKYLKLQLEAEAVKREIEGLKGSQEQPGPLWSLIETYGAHNKPLLPRDSALVHEKTKWHIVGTQKPRISIPIAIDLLRLATIAATAKPGSQRKEDAFQAFKSKVEQYISKTVIFDDKQLWSQIESMAVMFNSNIIAIQEYIDMNIWNSYEDDKNFKFPSVLKTAAKKEHPTYTLNTYDIVDDL